MDSIKNLLILPGNIKANREWGREIAEGLKSVFSGIRVMSYHHWETGAPLIDFELEKKRVLEYSEGFAPFVVLAKSAGVLLALDAIDKVIMSPEKCIFVGTAVHLARKVNLPLDAWLRAYSIPTLWIQKEDDPACGGRALSDLLRMTDVQNSTFKEIPGESHNYELGEVRELIEGFVQEHPVS